MSHVVEKEPESADQAITSLFLLSKAAERCGLEFREGQTKFHSWKDDHNGRLVGDYPLPEGRTATDVGTCLHAIGIPKDKQGANVYGKYEIGIVESKRFPGTFSLMYDFYGGRLGNLSPLEQSVGKGCEDLLMFHQLEGIKFTARTKGHVYREEKQTDGTFIAVVEGV